VAETVAARKFLNFRRWGLGLTRWLVFVGDAKRRRGDAAGAEPGGGAETPGNWAVLGRRGAEVPRCRM